MKIKYNNARTLFATAQLNWLVDDFVLVLLSASYSPSASHASMADVPAFSVLAESPLLTGKTVVNGYCRFAPVEFLLLSTPQPVAGVAIYKDAVLPADQLLVYFTDEGYGLPFTPQALDYVIAHDLGTGAFRV